MRAERAEDLLACEKWLASASVGSKTAPPNGRRRHVHPQKLRSGETDCCKLVWDSALPLLRPQRHHPIRPARPTGRENDAKRSRRRPARPPSPKSAGRGRSRRKKRSTATARPGPIAPSRREFRRGCPYMKGAWSERSVLGAALGHPDASEAAGGCHPDASEAAGGCHPDASEAPEDVILMRAKRAEDLLPPHAGHDVGTRSTNGNADWAN